MEFLVRFSQAHESFRLPELQALADLEGIDMKVVEYSLDVSLEFHQFHMAHMTTSFVFTIIQHDSWLLHNETLPTTLYSA